MVFSSATPNNDDMLHRLALLGAWVTLSLALEGCSKDPYQEVVDQQVSNWNDLADILATVKDRADMEPAEARIAARVRKFQEVALDAKLMAPPDPDTLARLEAQRKRMQDALDRFRAEMTRVKTLPGGEEFFDRVGKSIASNPRGSSK